MESRCSRSPVSNAWRTETVLNDPARSNEKSVEAADAGVTEATSVLIAPASKWRAAQCQWWQPVEERRAPLFVPIVHRHQHSFLQPLLPSTQFFNPFFLQHRSSTPSSIDTPPYSTPPFNTVLPHPPSTHSLNTLLQHTPSTLLQHTHSTHAFKHTFFATCHHVV